MLPLGGIDSASKLLHADNQSSGFRLAGLEASIHFFYVLFSNPSLCQLICNLCLLSLLIVVITQFV